MKYNSIYEVDEDGMLHAEDDELSEDVMDLDRTEVLNFLDINHELLPREEGVGFEHWLGQRLDGVEVDEGDEDLEDSTLIGIS